MPRLLWLTYFCCQVLALSGCQFLPNQGQDKFAKFHFSKPTKDDVAIIDGRSLTLSHFLAIRSRLQTPSTHFTFWVATAIFTLQSESRSKLHKELNPLAALAIVRYAIGELPQSLAIDSLSNYFTLSEGVPSPDDVHKEIDRLAQEAIIVKNSQILSQI